MTEERRVGVQVVGGCGRKGTRAHAKHSAQSAAGSHVGVPLQKSSKQHGARIGCAKHAGRNGGAARGRAGGGSLSLVKGDSGRHGVHQHAAGDVGRAAGGWRRDAPGRAVGGALHAMDGNVERAASGVGQAAALIYIALVAEMVHALFVVDSAACATVIRWCTR